MTRFRRLALFASIAWVAVFASRAWGRGDPRIGLDVAFGISGSTELRTVLMASPLLTLSAPTSAEGGFALKWGFTVASGDPVDPFFAATYVAMGNPLLSWAIRIDEGLVFTPGFTLPLARASRLEADRPAAGFAHEGARGLHGGADPWLWLPDEFAIVLPVTWVRWFDPLLIEAHVKFAFLAPTSKADADSDFVFEGQVRVAVRAAEAFWVAVTGTGVYTPTDTIDNFQASLAPELRYVLGPGRHMSLALVMNLDTPLGPFTEPGRYWGVQLGGSSRF